ncbi:MAG: Type II secretory pathway, pullulanase PulA [Rhodobacteraceae bacterium]|nr:MAG: Type II secretory pathway, pullulanase PulA [Paracoccaceae bacterium]
MIISHGRSYVFVHIPKTGGTSLSLALEDRAMKDDILVGDTPKAQKRRSKAKALQTSGRLWKHARLRDIYGAVTQDQIERYTVFTIVRNPWDRVVSYYHWLREQNFQNPVVALAQSISFDAFIRTPAIKNSLFHDAAQSYVSDADGVDRCDFYLRLECLAQDSITLANLLGLKLDLPHVNQSPRSTGYQSYYTAETRDLVADYCAQDINQFDYQF